MKTTLKILAVLVAMVGFSAASYAQSASATAAVTIVAPLVITNTGNMSFGNVAVNATDAGTVVLSPAGARTSTGGVQLSPTNLGTITAATFGLIGEGSYGYAITLPANGVVTVNSGANSMALNSFTSNPSGTGALSGGNGTIAVGATLVVAGGQATGSYTGTFNVTVAYN